MRTSNHERRCGMAQSTIVKTQYVVEYMGDGTKSGGTYTYSNLKHTASDDQIELAARAVTDLQSKTVKNIFKVVSAEISE